MQAQETEVVERVRRALGQRSLVMVGLMGCGKSSVGKRLASKLGLPFIDADEEIEQVAQKTINEIFADHGEAFFRDREGKVIARLLASGPQVLATGGGAFINPETRAKIKESGITIWLKAELPVLLAPGRQARHAAPAQERRSRGRHARAHGGALSDLRRGRHHD